MGRPAGRQRRLKWPTEMTTTEVHALVARYGLSEGEWWNFEVAEAAQRYPHPRTHPGVPTRLTPIQGLHWAMRHRRASGVESREP